MSSTAVRQQHATWLSLIDTQGPFLTLPVLTRTLHDGLEPVSKRDWNALRPAYQTWAADRGTAARAELAQKNWVRHVVSNLLDWDTDADLGGTFDEWSHTEPEHDVTVTPSFTLNDTTGKPVVLGFAHPYGTPLTGRVKEDGWAANRLDRAAATLRAAGVEFGLVTDGRWWALVWAPRGGATAHAIWDAVLWLEDRTTLDAFTTLTSRRRFLAVADNATLKGMLVASLDSQEEVTDQLGKQVRAAAEFLVESFGRADHHEGGHRLIAVDNDDIYNGAVTILMRLVFMFCAEERRLLPADSDFYLRAYSVSSLADRLSQEAIERGESTLEHSTAAWHQLLATFRIVYAGSHHQAFSMPGYGGSIFDPTKYPWLEGDSDQGPIAVDDRTVHHILRGLTRLTFREKGVTESRRISYRALDVEQIGYVYEGLLDHTATRAGDTTLGFTGKKEPELALGDIEAVAERGDDLLYAWLGKETGLSATAIKKGLKRQASGIEEENLRRLVFAACDNDSDLAERVVRYAPLLRTDPRGLPIVYLPDRLFVTSSSTRGDTGTHYTPRDLAERVVESTLEALVYNPGPLDTDDRDQWRLIPGRSILNLKIADIAMGSGAFLVAACRYLAERLLEAILTEDPDILDGELVNVWVMATDRVAEIATADAEVDEAILYARRLVTENCLYGVDLNPMAVEMAKLSLWLITAARDRPFGFLDHRLTFGDSLLGLTDVRQVGSLHIDPTRGLALHSDTLLDHTSHVERALRAAAKTRAVLAATPALDLRAVDTKREILRQAQLQLEDLNSLANALTAAAIAASMDPVRLDANTLRIAQYVPAIFDSGDDDQARELSRKTLRALSDAWLNQDLPGGAFPRHPMQWVTQFPEVFMDPNASGFDAVIGNPPFVRGRSISNVVGKSAAAFLIKHVARGRAKGTADLVAYFLLTASHVTATGGQIGLIATNSVSEGDTREASLDVLTSTGWGIREAVRSMRWPTGSASLMVCMLWMTRQPFATATLDGHRVEAISSALTRGRSMSWVPKPLRDNKGIAFKGSEIYGPGFLLTWEAARTLISSDPRYRDVLFPYLSGQDLMDQVDRGPTRWVINFHDWSLDRAATYPHTLEIVERLVKPDRDKVKRAARRERWWQYGEKASGLYTALSGLDRAIALPFTSNTVYPGWIPTDQVVTNGVVVFPSEDDRLFALLASSIHLLWAFDRASTLGVGDGLRYAPTDIAQTLPQPDLTESMGAAGRELDGSVRSLMRDRAMGATAAFALVGDESCAEPDVSAIRAALKELDHAVFAAYGWDSSQVKHVFRKTRFGVRFILDEDSADHVVTSLLEMNRMKFHHEKSLSKPKTAARAARVRPTDDKIGIQDELF